MKEFRVDIYQRVNWTTEEFNTEVEAYAFAAKLRAEMAQKAGKDWQDFHFEVEKLESADE